MRESDIEAAYMVASFALADSEREVLDRRPEEKDRYISGFHHYLKHDPDGCFVATDEEDQVIGVSVALMREGLWVLALLAVSGSRQGSGVGRSLIGRTLEYGGDFTEGMIAASTHPAAMRTYANAGFVLHPTFTAKGRVRRDRVPSNLNVREGDVDDLELAAEVDRYLRGAAHGPDLELLLEQGEMLVSETGSGRGYAFLQNGSVALFGATSEAVASELLWTYLDSSEVGKEVEVRWITARQDWAVRVVHAAGLDLVPDGPICIRGDPGPLTPYLPSGPFL